MVRGSNLGLLLIPQSFWVFGSIPSGIVASHSFHCCICVSSLCLWRLVLSIVVVVFPRPFFPRYCSFRDVYCKLFVPNYTPYPWFLYIFKFFFRSNVFFRPLKNFIFRYSFRPHHAPYVSYKSQLAVTYPTINDLLVFSCIGDGGVYCAVRTKLV
jgi:hypothetical protein